MIKKSSKYGLIFSSALFFAAFPNSSSANSVLIECFTDECILAFDVNAGWEQKAVITGPNGYHITLTGQGEGVRVFEDYVECGVYEVTLFHNSGEGWYLSDIEADESAVFGDDRGGRRQDFNDAVVTLKQL